jgi:hypothetical protein
MKPHTQVLILILAAPLTLANETPLKVDANKVLTFAVATVNEQFPEISAGDLAVEGSLDFQCWLTQPNETVLALDGEFRPCIATLDFVLTTEKPGLKYVDRDGNCEIDPILQGLHVGFFPGDSISVGVKHRSGSGNDVVDCITTSGNQSSDAPPQPLANDAYEIETREIVEVAFAAAIKKYPDISPDDLELGMPMVQLSCHPTFSVEQPIATDVDFAPCAASVMFSSPSSIVEYRYVDADGKCNVMRGPENIKVQIGGGEIDHDCARGSFGVTEELVVECTEEFDDAERWTNN